MTKETPIVPSSVKAKAAGMKPKKWRFASIGSPMVVLRGSYTQMLMDSMQQPTIPKRHPAIKTLFKNGYYETNDDLIAEGLQEQAQWGNDYYWHHTMADTPNIEFDEELAARYKRELVAKAERGKRARRQFLERGAAPRE